MSKGPRPQVWVTGPDPLRHLQYRAFIQQRNQARWRGEEWTITFEQWLDLWGDRYHLRGRTVNSLCLTRRDYDLPWTQDNTEVVSRQEHNQRQSRRGRRSRQQIEADRARGIVRKSGRRMPI